MPFPGSGETPILFDLVLVNGRENEMRKIISKARPKHVLFERKPVRGTCNKKPCVQVAKITKINHCILFDALYIFIYFSFLNQTSGRNLGYSQLQSISVLAECQAG